MTTTKRRRAAGLCLGCGRDKRPDRVHCEPCAQRHRDYDRAMRARRRAAGLCAACGVEPSPAGHYCAPCNMHQKIARGLRP